MADETGKLLNGLVDGGGKSSIPEMKVIELNNF